MKYKEIVSKVNNLDERYELVTTRINGITQEIDENIEKSSISEYFKYTFELAAKIVNLYNNIKNDKLGTMSLDKLKKNNDELHGDLIAGNYDTNFANPEYVYNRLLVDMEEEEASRLCKLLTYMVAELRACIPYAYEQRKFEITIIFELLNEIYNIFSEKDVDVYREVKSAIYYSVSDYSDIIQEIRLCEQFDKDFSFATDIIMNEDLNDLRYLYKYGEYVSDCEIEMAKHLNSLSQDEIDSMARTYTEGYKQGFVAAGIDLSKKSYVNIRYRLGFERMVRAAIMQFRKMGLEPLIYRVGHIASQRGVNKVGYYSTSPNNQYDYDHRFDKAVFTDKAMLDKFLVNSRVLYEKYSDILGKYAGPACIEVFGEKTFLPKAKEKANSYNEKQEKIFLEYQTQAAILSNEYLKRNEISFTIIAYPVPDIGEQFNEIFNETVKVNTLDMELYKRIQQTIIDCLDKGDYVTIKGMKGNRTDLKVYLYKLSNPDKETIFENCLADVNIPVGEVFTSPVLEGTDGVLHVSEVFLNELKYIDLELTFKDGKVVDYRCGNFDNEEDGKKYIKENLLYNHETLPIGEFAIGTNTTAYVMGQNYNIADKLPILIAEKTGPHFAIGDTCYHMSEDLKVYNPDGKEIVAKDNEISIMRKTEIDKAYFNCHIDITIPYNELGEIVVHTTEGENICIIKEGRFVLEGTKELNKPFEDLK